MCRDYIIAEILFHSKSEFRAEGVRLRRIAPRMETMKTLAYLRVSKDTQDVKNQKLAIFEFAQREKIEVNHFIELSASSRKSTKKLLFFKNLLDT